ncbi:MAG TPA: ATP-binding protein [Opitutaceae bacterium]|nr:ATP-binding protein [Opitutaceae bacterium]
MNAVSTPSAAATLSAAGTERPLLDLFLESVPDYVYFKDRESRFVAVSTSLVHAFGQTSARDVIGKTDFDFYAQAHAQPAFEDEQRIIQSGEPLVEKLEKEYWPTGRVTWVTTTKMPLRNNQGAIVGTFGITRDITEKKRIEAELAKAHKDLVDASRVEGMAEVATGVLHNVGNVLNSLNVSAAVIASGLRQSKAESLTRLTGMLREHDSDLGAYLTADPKGRKVPEFLESLAQHFTEERTRLLQEISSLQKNIDHIKEIVAMQQAYATMIGVVEALDPVTLLEDALRMNAGALVRHDVRVERDYHPVPRIVGEKAKVLQILINLIRNAKYACDDGGSSDKCITLRLRAAGDNRVQLIVQDNGVGIPHENFARIFQHGFTTRAAGHGFGLHSAANVAREMRGTITAQSDGPGLGATFTVELPVAPPTLPSE